ncbi:MAG: hypothetical protein J2P57_15530 [Acidimicrobiaceae bacterium]|nr:hypothetical protein [Acidimicrobiaceae bacterium]
MIALVPLPSGADVHRGERRVRLADVDGDGRVRFDALARYLQDVAADDARRAPAEALPTWVVRRTAIAAARLPRYEEPLQLVTWCSGTGAAWAERRTSITGARGASVEAVSLWVSVDRATLRPVLLGDAFLAWAGEAARARRVPSGLHLPASAPSPASPRSWPLRRSDFDVLGHLNNTVSWAAAEEEAHRVTGGQRLSWGEVEYRLPVDSLDALSVVSRLDGDEVTVWLLDSDRAVASVARFGVRP